jgi:AraC-like DNA-binding protein
MKKRMDLKNFDIFQYLREQQSHNLQSPYLLADQDTYKKAAVRFPFRTFAYGIGLTYSGKGGLFKVGSVEYDLKPGSLMTIGPGIVGQWLGDYKSIHDTVYFTDDFFKDNLRSSFLKSLPFFQPGGTHLIGLEDEFVKKVKTIFEQLKLFKDDPEVIVGLVYALLALTIKCHGIQKIKATPSIREKLVSDFKSLLARFFLEQKDVAFYARRLHVTPKHLSEVLLAETGKSAKMLINDHIFFEAKSLLKQTSMPVKEICHWLGYSDAAYFIKAFKRREGVTPQAYRKI